MAVCADNFVAWDSLVARRSEQAMQQCATSTTITSQGATWEQALLAVGTI